MQEIFQFLQDYETWIYAILGVIGLIYLRRVIVTYQEWRGAVYGLERESAQRQFSASLTIIVFIGLFIGLELILVSFVAPAYAGLQPLATPTMNILATPTMDLNELPSGPVATPTTMAVATAALSVEGCLPGQIEWIAPSPGEEIRSGTVELWANVLVTNLGFYKYEYSQPGNDAWNTIAGGNQLVNAEVDRLGEWNTSQLLPGDYLLRLVVMDNQNNAFPVCIIPIRVLAP